MGRWWRPSKVILRQSRDHRGYRYLCAELQANGDLLFVGQDLGSGVNDAFGYREYEWQWTVKAVDIRQLRTALGAREPLLKALARRFQGPRADDLYTFLCSEAIPFESHSRIGD